MGMPSTCDPCGDTSHSRPLSLLRFSLWPATEELFRACFVQAFNYVSPPYYGAFFVGDGVSLPILPQFWCDECILTHVTSYQNPEGGKSWAKPLGSSWYLTPLLWQTPDFMFHFDLLWVRRDRKSGNGLGVADVVHAIVRATLLVARSGIRRASCR